jgi:hypothetical protein
MGAWVDARGDRGRRFRVFAWGAAALVSAWIAFFLQDSWARFPRGLLTDDAYFYVKIAWNLGLHGASTFDGLHVTDGYHLLWAWMLAAVSAFTGLFTAAPSMHLGAMLWLYLMVCWAIALRFGRGLFDVLLLFFLGLAFKALMETTLLALLLLWLWEKEYLPQNPARRWRLRPLLLVLIPLVRVDAVLIAGVMALAPAFDASRAPRGARWRAVAADLGWIAVGFVLQLGVHFAIFREPATVSMLLKGFGEASWAERLRQNFTGFYGANLISVVIFAAFWGLASGAALRRPRAERARHLVVLLAPALFVLFHLAANGTISYWYFVPAVLPHAAYFLRWGPARRSSFGLAGRAVILAVVLLFAAKWAVDTRVRAPQIENSRRFVEEVSRRVPFGEPIYQIDASGWVGWFSGRKVVNGDGLVNDHAYARRLGAGTLSGYLREEQIRYVIHNIHPEDGLLFEQGGLSVRLDSVETLIAPPPGYPRLTAFGLYRLRAPRNP